MLRKLVSILAEPEISGTLIGIAICAVLIVTVVALGHIFGF